MRVLGRNCTAESLACPAGLRLTLGGRSCRSNPAPLVALGRSRLGFFPDRGTIPLPDPRRTTLEGPPCLVSLPIKYNCRSPVTACHPLPSRAATYKSRRTAPLTHRPCLCTSGPSRRLNNIRPRQPLLSQRDGTHGACRPRACHSPLPVRLASMQQGTSSSSSSPPPPSPLPTLSSSYSWSPPGGSTLNSDPRPPILENLEDPWTLSSTVEKSLGTSSPSNHLGTL